jgi:hypothetical protein
VRSGADAAPAGVLVVHVWTEQGMPELRARLIEAHGLEDARTGPAAAGVDGICDAVRAWLESLVVARDCVTPS